MGVPIPKVLDELTGILLSYSQVGKILEINPATIREWGRLEGLTTVSEFRDRKKIKGKCNTGKGAIRIREKKLTFSKGKTCYRDKFRERCIHYLVRLEIVSRGKAVPSTCCSVVNDSCPNYKGERYDTRHLAISSLFLHGN